MKKVKLLGAIAAVIFLSAFSISDVMVWNIESEHSIAFDTKKVKGNFEDFKGDIVFDQNNLTASRFDVQIDVKSIKTGNFLKNRHAKGKNWFDAKNYPTINFTSKSFNESATGYEVTGTLEIHGVQKEITMPFTFENDVFKSSFSVNRTDYNVGSIKGMSKNVGQEIQLNIAVPVSR